MADDYTRDQDLVLPQNTYAYVLDKTKGNVDIYVGPHKTSLSQTDRLVVWNGSKFVETNSDAIQSFLVAQEGQYIVLQNPANTDTHPGSGSRQGAVDLNVGRKVNLPGPAAFALWPGQKAQLIDGHRLRSNQYLIVRVYDPTQAQANWNNVVIASQNGDADLNVDAADFSVGQLIVIKGTEASFFLPPTGIEVVPEEGTNGYVRDAVTLERLEYCILLKENGEKRYVQGPAVVFPEPTEKFVESQGMVTYPNQTPRSDKSRKFRAIELNPHSGIHVKVTADYNDDDEQVRYTAGDEMFITGDDTPIYFPRTEHSIIKYEDRQIHYAIAIPAGEGRYVLNRDTGSVDLIEGPAMFLPDPRKQVVVRRILSEKMVELLYPGNNEAKAVNATYRQEAEEQVEELSNVAVAAASAYEGGVGAESYNVLSRGGKLMGVTASIRSANPLVAGVRNAEFGGDSFSRGTVYRGPRTLTLDTKYDGAVAVNIWPGYAILVTDKAGNRRVELGPKMVLLNYDEIVQPIELSTGRPKTDTNLLRTAYLRVGNNHVSDTVDVQTKDLVDLEIEVSYRVNFEGEDTFKWFDVENYVKVMTDHGRSKLRNAVKQLSIQDFYSNSINVIRDVILGAKAETGDRPGLFFEENFMHVYDVEVLNVDIQSREVASLLYEAQSKALQGAIKVTQAEEEAGRTTILESFTRTTLQELATTSVLRSELTLAEISRRAQERSEATQADLMVALEANKIHQVKLDADRMTRTQDIELVQIRNDVDLALLSGETDQHVRRMGAISEDLITALNNLGDKTFVANLIESAGGVAMALGVTTADVLQRIVEGTPFEGIMNTLTERPGARGITQGTTN